MQLLSFYSTVDRDWNDLVCIVYGSYGLIASTTYPNADVMT